MGLDLDPSSVPHLDFNRSATYRRPEEWHPAASFRISTHLLSLALQASELSGVIRW